jgi:hypothetical protein
MNSVSFVQSLKLFWLLKGIKLSMLLLVLKPVLSSLAIVESVPLAPLIDLDFKMNLLKLGD